MRNTSPGSAKFGLSMYSVSIETPHVKREALAVPGGTAPNSNATSEKPSGMTQGPPGPSDVLFLIGTGTPVRPKPRTGSSRWQVLWRGRLEEARRVGLK